MNGKICYVEMPTTDVNRSADFYSRVFGWHIRRRGDGATAFDDTTGQVSGTWVLGRPPSTSPGLLIYIMVDSVAAAIEGARFHSERSTVSFRAQRPRTRSAVSFRAQPRSGEVEESRSSL